MFGFRAGDTLHAKLQIVGIWTPVLCLIMRKDAISYQNKSQWKLVYSACSLCRKLGHNTIVLRAAAS